MIRQENAMLPPKPFMMQILDNTSLTYIYLWDRKDEDYRITLAWNEISKHHNKNAFKNSLRKLNNKGLLDYRENNSEISVELVSWEDFEME